MPHSICHAPLATQRMSYSLRTNRKSIKKLNYKSFGGSDDPEEKNIKPLPKTCGDGAKTTYGAPHGDEEFEIGHVVNLAFNDRTKSFKFEVKKLVFRTGVNYQKKILRKLESLISN